MVSRQRSSNSSWPRIVGLIGALAAMLLPGACRTAPEVVAAIEAAAIGLPIESVRTDGIWSTGEPGHGLQVTVRATGAGADYRPDLDRELDCAARVCAAIAGSVAATAWDYVDVYLFVAYRFEPEPPNQVVGVARVILRRELLLELRESDAGFHVYRRRWRFVSGHKDSPNGNQVLEW